MKSIFHLPAFATDIDRHLSPRYELLMVIRRYLKNADYVQGQEAHLNQYNQMCYPAYAGARADEKAPHTWEYVSILRRSATP
jgi:hypothetical protein